MVQDFSAALGDLFVTEGVSGYVLRRVEKDRVLLENVAVDPAHKGEGIGRRLIGFLENEARLLGLPVELYTNEAMVENLALYPRFGYREIARRTENGLRRVYFRKDL